MWVVQLFVDGPVTVRDHVKFQHPKGFSRRRLFYSDIAIQNTSSGLRMSVTAHAREIDAARKAALVFAGEMLDVAATELNLPLRLTLYDPRNADRSAHSVKRVVTEEEFRQAFGRARRLSEEEPTFLRALSWFRKALITEDPLDRFYAFWLSLEITTGKYHPNVPEAAKGSKSQMWESFKSLWGDVGNWPIIPGEQDWIDENYALRVEIAHGTAAADIEAVERAAARADTIREVAHRFLTGWARHRFQDAYSELMA
jgi:hypothetical protein